MSDNLKELHESRQAILNGISQNLKLTEIATHLGVRRGDLQKYIKAMRRNRDIDLFDAQRIRKAKVDEEKQLVSKRRQEMFFNMTGMTLHEKSFQNMVYFYKAELLHILKSRDQESAISKLSKCTRRTLIHNGILTKGRKPKISQRAIDQLL